jgi:hypothetical protein
MTVDRRAAPVNEYRNRKYYFIAAYFAAASSFSVNR